MRKISLDNIHEKKQHMEILDKLYDNYKGLTLHDLTYLLTKKGNMQLMSKLQKRLGSERKDIFKTNRRICDCLFVLKNIKFVYKEGKKYKLNIDQIVTYYFHRQSVFLLYKMEEEYKKSKEKLKQYPEKDRIVVKRSIKSRDKPPWRLDEKDLLSDDLQFWYTGKI